MRYQKISTREALEQEYIKRSRKRLQLTPPRTKAQKHLHRMRILATIGPVALDAYSAYYTKAPWASKGAK